MPVCTRPLVPFLCALTQLPAQGDRTQRGTRVPCWRRDTAGQNQTMARVVTAAPVTLQSPTWHAPGRNGFQPRAPHLRPQMQEPAVRGRTHAAAGGPTGPQPERAPLQLSPSLWAHGTPCVPTPDVSTHRDVHRQSRTFSLTKSPGARVCGGGLIIPVNSPPSPHALPQPRLQVSPAYSQWLSQAPLPECNHKRAPDPPLPEVGTQLPSRGPQPRGPGCLPMEGWRAQDRVRSGQSPLYRESRGHTDWSPTWVSASKALRPPL